jgi:neutral ceramidase
LEGLALTRIRRQNELMRSVAFLLLAGISLAPAQTLRVGAAQVVISRAVGTPMAGYYSTRLSTGVHDDLHAKAIVLASGDQRAALVACDLVGIPPAVIEEARELIRKATGIPGENVMISATHSHTGPLIPDGGARAEAYGGGLEIAKRRRAELPAKIAESVRLANARMMPARVSFGKGREESVSFNRTFGKTQLQSKARRSGCGGSRSRR